jgi:hypothetical protein
LLGENSPLPWERGDRKRWVRGLLYVRRPSGTFKVLISSAPVVYGGARRRQSKEEHEKAHTTFGRKISIINPKPGTMILHGREHLFGVRLMDRRPHTNESSSTGLFARSRRQGFCHPGTGSAKPRSASEVAGKYLRGKGIDRLQRISIEEQL